MSGVRRLALAALPLLLRAADWPAFRGPGGQGHSSEAGAPLHWGPAQNIRWKTAIPGVGWSSPSIEGGLIWLTTATEEGRSLRALAVDRETGKIVRDVEVFHLPRTETLNPKNNPASPTPIVEGERVYVHFGYFGTAAITTAGEIVWTTRLMYEPQHGPGGSPALYEDLLLINCDGFDAQYIVALDKATGKVRWKRNRKGNQAYTTPLVISVDGADQAISVGAFQTIAYRPRTGQELWSVRYGDGFSNVPRPVFGNGLVYITSGFHQATLLAVRPGGKGDVTGTHVAWTLARGVPLTPSPILVGSELYLISDNGIASCLDAVTGKSHWQQRLGASFSASPVYVGGSLYFLSEEGDTTVIEPGVEFRKVAVNTMDERALASLAPAGGALFLRTERNLYRIEEPRR